MSAPPNMEGFSVAVVAGWCVVCDECGDSIEVRGPAADVSAITWATEHRLAHTDDEPSEAELIRYYHSGGGEDPVSRQQIRDAGRPGL